MVHPKKRSGDPDYDDKQPKEFHAGGNVVSAGDGIFITPQGGVVDENGAHVNLAVDTMDLDNRPAPGEVATEPSEVQDYTEEDTGMYVDAEQADVDKIADAQASVRAAATAGPEDETPATDEPKPAVTPAKKTAPAATKDASSK